MGTLKVRKTVLMIGCFDTKGEDFKYLHTCIERQGLSVISINTGVRGTTTEFSVDYEAEEVASVAGADLIQLREEGDRGKALQKLGEGAAIIISKLLADNKIDGAIGMGGGGGTYLALSAMQAIPLGVPKLCLTTLATKDLSDQIGTKDITLMPSVVDVAGLNSISRQLINQAAGAICGMVNAGKAEQTKTMGSIAISIFGNTTPCVDKCSALLKDKGYDVLTFHAVGVGGKTMEALILEGCFDAVLDITTTELADNLCGGICSAGPNRLTAASEMGIPQVVVPGCLDMVNFGAMDTVPEKYKKRNLYCWDPNVTLLRTDEEENKALGTELAEKLNKSIGEVAVLLPMGGISQVSMKGETFYDPKADQALFDAIKSNLKDSIVVEELDAAINDPSFAERSVEVLLRLMGSSKK